ncbi:hypothetical protein C100_04275 [Sphingobium sp. C100]|nr:hypothetical protein C100_04275 [Sphingobium sp. C100]
MGNDMQWPACRARCRLVAIAALVMQFQSSCERIGNDRQKKSFRTLRFAWPRLRAP